MAARKYNCAAAGAITNVCIARIKQLEFEIDTDFPGYGSFDAIVNTFLHGKDPDKLRSMMSVGLYKVGDNNSFEPAIELKALDIKECVLINAYRDITAFLTDYRKNRSGKPTKAMMQRTRGWDPLLNLSTVSEEERLQWRSVYAIKWLYDLVNTYAFPALSMVMSGELEKSKLENMNWGEDNEWGGRTMWGPVEFAADLTGFSMKTSARLPAVILPHHVFTMQAALDSMTASRGWTHNPLTGPVVVPAPVKMWSNHSAHAEIDEVIENEDRGFRTGANL